MNCANYSALLHRQKLIWSHSLSLLPLYCVLLGSFSHHRHHHFCHIARCSRCSASLFCSVCSVFFVYIAVILFIVCYLSRWIKLFTFIHKWNEPHLPLLPSCRASQSLGRYSFTGVEGYLKVGGNWGGEWQLASKARRPKVGLGFLGRGSQLPPHQLEGLGQRCKLPQRNEGRRLLLYYRCSKRLLLYV